MKKAKKFWCGSFLPNGDTGRFKKKIAPKPHSGIRMRQFLVPVVHRFFAQDENRANGWIDGNSNAGQWISKIAIDGKFVDGVIAVHRKKRKIVM